MINDPYAVLGLSKGASEAEIKAAYHELVKKYHPDKYQGNPLADLAQEKLQEINEAYDMLTRNSGSSYSGGSTTYGPGSSHYGGGTSGGYQSSYNSSYNNSYNSGYSGNSGSATDYNQIRMALDANDLYSAEQMLINSRNHDAEWFFLSGVLSYKKGYIQDALANVNQAISMDPGNQQYREIYQQMANSGAGQLFRQRSDQYGYNQNRNSDADLCMALPLCFCLPNPFCWC